MCVVMMLGIVLSWNMVTTNKHEPAASYQLYAYQEGSEAASTTLWKRVSCLFPKDYFLICLTKPRLILSLAFGADRCKLPGAEAVSVWPNAQPHCNCKGKG